MIGLYDKNNNIQPYISLDDIVVLPDFNLMKKEINSFFEKIEVTKDGDGFYEDEIEFWRDDNLFSPDVPRFSIPKDLKEINELYSFCFQLFSEFWYLRIIPRPYSNVHSDQEELYKEGKMNPWFWMKVDDKRKFCVHDIETNQEHWVDSKVLIFNKVDFHSGDGEGYGVRLAGNPLDKIKSLVRIDWNDDDAWSYREK